MTWSLRKSVGALVLTGTVGVLACNETPVGLPTATSIAVSTATLSLFVGETAQVSAQVLDQNGEVLPEATVQWSSSDQSMARVDAEGDVLARGVGTATLTATSGSLSGTISVTVSGAASVVVFPGAIQLVATGNSQEVTAQVLGAQGELIETAVMWHSLDPSVATVGASGTVEFVRAVDIGTTSVVAEALGATDTIQVSVVADERLLVTRISFLGPDTVTMDVAGGTQTVMYSAIDGDGDEVCQFGGPLAIRISDPSVIGAFIAFGNCAVNVTPVAAGSSWLVLENNTAADSVWVDVTSIVFTAMFSLLPNDTLTRAGDTVSYGAAVIDEAGQPAAGVVLNFDVTGGALSSKSVTTDANGTATVSWYLPQSPISVSGTLHTIRFRATLPNGFVIGDIGHVETVVPGPGADMWMAVDIDGNFVPDDTLFDGESVTIDLGNFPYVAAQTLDRFANFRNTDVIFSVSDPGLIEDEWDGFTASQEATRIFPKRLGTFTLTATEGAASATISIVAAVGPEAVLIFDDGSNRVWTGQPTLPAFPGTSVTDSLVYDGGSGASLYPTFTTRSDTVGFAWDDGLWNVALAASDGSNSAAPIGVLLPDNKSSAPWGFPVFLTAGAGEAGDVVFLSDRDIGKLAAGPVQTQWDLYSLDRSTAAVTKLTNTSEDSTHIIYNGLSLSPSETTVLVVSEEAINPGDGSTRFSQIYEISLATGAITQLTSNSDGNIEYRYATYSPDASLIYADVAVFNWSSEEIHLFEYDRTTFRLLSDNGFERLVFGPLAGERIVNQVSFNPGNLAVFLRNDEGFISFVDVNDPQTILTTGRTGVAFISWSAR